MAGFFLPSDKCFTLQIKNMSKHLDLIYELNHIYLIISTERSS